MRIDSRAPLAAAAASAAARRGGPVRERFAPGEAARAGGAAPAVSLANVDALLALQGEESPGERRRRHARRGHDLLEGLDRLKAALLGGRLPAAEIRRLAAALASGAGASGDGGLDEIVGQIELRTAVELAKLGAA